MKQRTGWILYNRQDARRNARYIEFHREEGAKRGMDIQLVLIEELSFGVENGQYVLNYQNQKDKKPDFAIVRMNYPLLTKQLEAMQIPVFNNSKTAEICNDKARTYQYVAQLELPMVDSQFVHKLFLMENLERKKRPYVVKAVSGHGGSQVFLVTEETDTQQLHEIYEKLDDHVVIQPLTGTRHQDLRVYVVGREIIGAVLRTAKDGFKSNFSLGGEVEFYNLSTKEREQVQKIINIFDFDLVGIDFIIGDQGELIFNEIEDVVGSRMLYQSSNLNIVAVYLDYIEKTLDREL